MKTLLTTTLAIFVSAAAILATTGNASACVYVYIPQVGWVCI